MSCLRLVRHTTAASFLDRAQRFLVGAEAENVLLIGLAGAFGVGRLLESVVVQTSPTDPVALVSIVAVLIGAAVLAWLLPARRAAHLDPSATLRYE